MLNFLSITKSLADEIRLRILMALIFNILWNIRMTNLGLCLN